MAWHLGTWYNEFRGWRTHDYFSLMINQFPIIVVRKYDDCHAKVYRSTYSLAFFGITYTFTIDD